MRSLGLSSVIALLSLAARPQESPDDLELAVRKLQPAPGLKVTLFAAEPDVTNPIGIDVDGRGRVFLAETRRYNSSALYVKQHGHWYFDDLACRSVVDRIAVARKFLGADARKLEVDSEVVRLVEDTDGDGVADRSRIFADDFRTLLDGCASGVLVRGDEVWLANVPNLWRLGEGGKRERLLHGFGVRFGNSGHDLHGLVFGPDGKLYFSMGDRGLHVESAGRVVSAPDMGAVLRCNPDGSDLELFATGLRNPQGLAFDAWGNLWTCDNNADMGDAARWLYVAEGGDYGWRVGYQYATDPWAAQELKAPHYLSIARDNPWMSEDLWKGGAPYVLPPVGFISNGPCGIAYYPGTGLPERYREHFFLADFPGGIHALAVQPKGAFFELVDAHKFLWGGWPTDAKFGPDGALYVADWVQGFPMTGKGRVFKVSDPAQSKDPLVLETKELLAGGFSARSPEALIRLLGHADLRVRQGSQFALVSRGLSLVPLLDKAAGSDLLPSRLHALWALRQLGGSPTARALLRDPEPELRAQAARVLGELRVADSVDALAGLLEDPSLRVRGFAMTALGKAGRGRALEPALGFLRANGTDPMLRHAAVTALVEVGNAGILMQAAAKASPVERLGVLLALRRLEAAEIAGFLSDPDPALVLEAARAINDVHIPGAMDALADLLKEDRCPDTVRLRAIHAAFRRGRVDDASALARAAIASRGEAMAALAAWGRPSSRDRLTGLWRPARPRDAAPAREAFARVMEAALRDGSADVRREAIRAAAAFELPSAAPRVEALAMDPKGAVAERVEALQALLRLDPSRGQTAVTAAAADPDVALQREAVRLAVRLPAATASRLLKRASEADNLPLRQAAVTALGAVPGAEADGILEALLDRLLKGDLVPSLHLDVLESSGRKLSLREKLSRHEASRPADDPLGAYRETLEGGDPAAGRRIFFERSTVACLRCHKVGSSGGEVGPPLTAVGKERTREQILESIVHPNRQLVQGYGQEIVRTRSDVIEVGRVKSDTETELILILADGREKRIAKKDVAARKAGLSAMPDDLVKSLSKRDVRDLVAYLSGLKP